MSYFIGQHIYTCISDPVYGQLLMNNGSGWVNSNSYTITELLFTNSNHNIKFITTTLSRDGAVYTLPSQIGNNVDVLTVSGSTTSTNALGWSSISLAKFSDTGISNPVSGQVLSYNGMVGLIQIHVH